MFGILISALNTLLGFVFRSLIIKFVVILLLYFVVVGFVEILVELLPDSNNLSSLCLPIYQTDSGTSLT